jgi:NADH dehydrogenase FAD-containing subunit
VASGGRRSRESGVLTVDSEPRLLRRLVLVGGGRAHLRVLRAFAKPLVRGAELVLVSAERESFNPAMSAGLLRGAYSLDEARVDLAALVERAGARFVHAAMSRLDVAERVVVAGSERIPFDVCSLDVVGWPEGADLPGVVDHALPLRPLSALPDVRAAVETRLAQSSERIDCVVVGGGITGVETAFSMQRLLRGSASGGVVTIVDGADTILADGSPCRDAARRALERSGVCFALGSRAVAVERDGVLLASGARLPANLVLWATSGAPPGVIADSGLPHDAMGRLLVDATLRAHGGIPVWAAGDCASLDAQDVPAGPSQAAQLERSLRAALGATEPRTSASNSKEPCLLDTGDGRALVEWGAVHARTRWGWWLKQRRDRRFVADLSRP